MDGDLALIFGFILAIVMLVLPFAYFINRYELPGGSGWPVGVSVGQDGRLVTATSDGRVFGFAPA